MLEDWDGQDSHAADGDDPLTGDWLLPFAQDVRFASRGPVPVPGPELEAVLRSGFLGAGIEGSGLSIDKGDLLATAASNVHGPAPQAAGLPKWRKEPTMPAFLSAILAKLVGAGTAAKAAVATATVLTTMTVAGAAAGVLPDPAQGVVGGVINAVSPLNVPTGDPAATVDQAAAIVSDALASVPSSLPVDLPNLPAGADVTVNTPAGTATAAAATTSGLPLPSIPGASIPNIPVPSIPNIPVPSIPDVGGVVGSLPVALPACVTSLVPSSGAAPNPTALLAQIPGCIQTVLATAALPVDVSQCVASVMATVAGVLNPAAIGSLPNLDMSACVPLDVTECTSSMLAMADMALVGDVLGQIFGSGLGGLGGLAGLGGSLPIPGRDSIPAGCVPINIDDCLTSLTGGLATIPTSGALPQVNLSACMPTGLTSGIPGMGGGIPGLSGIPFLPFGG